MTGWAGGYVADIEYIPGYYREQSPSHLRVAGLLNRVDTGSPSDPESSHYLELGCGLGLNALLMAASNPGWRVTAIDYNPAHIAAANALAREARLANLTFIEADFATVADRHLPPADFVSMHGVWSWVSPGVREAVVRLLDAHVAPGGVVHLSYNALPAWQGAIGMQRFIYESGRRNGGRSDRQAAAGIDAARALHATGARYLTGGFPAEILEYLQRQPPAYLAHEYMNAHWSPCFHADVAAALSDAKLEWVASANLLESFLDLTLEPEQRAIHDAADDPLLRELIKDMCLPRQLRHDVFVRGAKRLTAAERDAALSGLTLAMTVPGSEFQATLPMPSGQAELGPGLRAMAASLAGGPSTVGALLATRPGESSPAELAGVLVGTNQAVVLARPNAVRGQAADRLNAVLGKRTRSVAGPEQSTGLASASLGAGYRTSRLLQFLAARLLDGDDDRLGAAAFDALSSDVPEDKHDALREMIRDAIEVRLPLLRRAGVIG